MGAPGRERYTDAAFEAHVGIGHASEEGLDEFIDLLARLARQISGT